MKQAFLSLGSNLGERIHYLDQACDRLSLLPEIFINKTSSYYETEPIGKTDQPWFINAVLEIQTTLDPYALLSQCQKIENALGRIRTERWGPRTIDIDILLYEDFLSQDPQLTLPHPQMSQRAFVLTPLLEIAPDAALNGIKCNQQLKHLPNDIVKSLSSMKL